MNQTYTKAQRNHVQRVKELPCSVCSAPSPSDAHHVKQSSPWTCVALCRDCHQGAKNGIHGQKVMWKINKMDELDALSVTLARLFA